MHIVSLTQLETVMLDDNDLLERNLLMVFVTPQKVEVLCDDEMVFPYPFAAMSEQGNHIFVVACCRRFSIHEYCVLSIECHSYITFSLY